ncbi:MAG: bifunctional riboflavin kinase/FAD synthetase [Candidatus Latescibacteria bacterium]|jgi:riboflavin kinase / FMN adenylyltransferase|nr:bifunctional riboflavin kinase/FAD synthetase [Candidatus Latescibacterota bacterium]
MKVYRNFVPNEQCKGLKTTITLGTFDGVHIGHRYILDKVISNTEKSTEQSAVVTFDRHPSSVIKPDSSPQLLTTLDEKLKLFESTGIDLVFILSFTKQFSEMSPELFVKNYLVYCMGMSHFVIGYDHNFGKERRGSIDIFKELSQKYNFTLEIQKPVTCNEMTVKSSTIRKKLLEGNVNIASALLGEDYSFRGSVVKGYGIGKKIGIPTANIAAADHEKIIPSNGVYAGWIKFDNQKKEAVLCIGTRPTFGKTDETIEVHIPEFKGDLYGKEVRIGFKRKLRNIEDFGNEQALVKQIKNDIEDLKTTSHSTIFKEGDKSTNGNYERTKKSVCISIR